MATNPFLDLVPSDQQSPAQPQTQPQGPQRFTVGTPRPREAPSGYQREPGGGLAYEPGGPADPYRPGGPQDPNRDPGVDQARMAGFLRRAARSNMLYEQQGVGPRSLPSQAARDTFPNVTNYFSSDERQQAEAAQDEFIAATLRYESGAAIPPEELEAQRRRYFPMPGDSEATVRLKAELRRTALEGLQTSAGPAGEDASRPGRVSDVRDAVRQARHRNAAVPDVPLAAGPGDPNANVEIFLGTPEEQERLAQEGAERWSAQRQAEAERRDPRRIMLDNAIADAGPLGSLYRAARGALGQEGGEAFRRGTNDTVTLGFADEIGGGIRSAVRGTSSADEIARERAIDAYDNENNFGARLGGQLVGGLTLPGAGTTAMQLARIGAVYGGAYGLGSAEGGLAERAPNALIGAGIGAATGGTLGYLGNRITRPAPQQTANGPEPAQIAQALIDEGIPAARPVADPSARGSMAYLETTRGGHQTVRDSLEATRAGIEGRAKAVREGGAVQTPGGMGDTIQSAGRRRIDALRQRGRAFYDRAAEEAGDAPINPQEMVASIDGYIERLGRNPAANRGTLAYLRSIRGDLIDVEGNAVAKTVADIRDIRTGLGDEISRRNLTRTRAEAIMEDVIGAGTRDIARDLGDASPQALRMYQRGDQVWSQMHTDRRQIVERLTGPADNPLSGERVLANVTNMMRNRGDYARFRRVQNMMTPEERADFAATIFESIGQRSPEDTFSPALFLANTQDMQPQALRTVFGEEGARSIQNLRLASRGFRDAVNSLNNSRSGFVNNFKDFAASLINLKTGGGAGAGFLVGGPAGAVAGAVAGEGVQRASNYLSARSLMNPTVSRWALRLARAREPGAIDALISDLSGIASRNPTISQDLLGLQRTLLQAANDNLPRVGTIAAQSPGQGPGDAQQ